MKRGYSKLLYSQRNKDETIVSVIKRLFGEHITSRLVRTQNRELSFRCIAYNIHRLTQSHYNIRWFLLSLAKDIIESNASIKNKNSVSQSLKSPVQRIIKYTSEEKPIID